MRSRLLALGVAAGLAVLVALPGVAAATASRPTTFAAPSAAVSKTLETAKTQHSSGSGSSGSAVTVTGPRMCLCTVTGAAEGNPQIGNTADYKRPSTVTVSQTTSLGNQDVMVSWSRFTPTFSVDQEPGYDPQDSIYPVLIAECQGYRPASPNDCYTAGGTGAIGQNAAYQSTPAFTVTAPNGTGEANIELLTSEQMQNPIRCDATHQCSLVVVPSAGGAEDTRANGTTYLNCNDHSQDLNTPQGATGGYDFYFATGNPWQCSWAKRIVIPLHFAPGLASCPQRNANFKAEGSPMLADTMTQWQEGLCLGSNSIEVNYNGTVNEDQARNDFQSGLTDVAFTTLPLTGPANHPFTYAPVAVSAVSVAFWVSNRTTGLPYSTIKLTPLLLAKQLTTSYNYDGFACHPTPQQPPSGSPRYPCDNAVNWDPMTIFSDPDFLKYNPGSWSGLANNPSNFDTPIVPSGNSDMTWVTTSWIGANKDASQFIAGKPETGKQYDDACLNNLTQQPIACHPHVNTNYKGMIFPTDEFLAADSNINMESQFVPVFPLSTMVTDMLNYEPSGYDYRPQAAGTQPNPPLAPEQPGQQDLWALIDQADAALNLFPVAYLQNAAGNFVQPTDQAMLAAVNDMTAGPGGTLSMNFTKKDPAAYPLTMVIYAVVPTGGISKAKASAIAQFLDYVANRGQQQGEAIGDLAVGYAPLPQSLRQQTLKAAYDVLHQTGGSGKKTSSPSTSSPSPSPSPTSASKKATPSPSPTPSSSSTPTAHSIAVSFSSPDAAGMSWVVFALLLAGGVLLVTGPAALIAGSPKARQAVSSGIRRISLLGSGRRSPWRGVPRPTWRRHS
jgi:hypothetical protein